jgi:hypothetical protein
MQEMFSFLSYCCFALQKYFFLVPIASLGPFRQKLDYRGLDRGSAAFIYRKMISKVAFLKRFATTKSFKLCFLMRMDLQGVFHPVSARFQSFSSCMSSRTN